jgi:hypothetical protein
VQESAERLTGNRIAFRIPVDNKKEYFYPDDVHADYQSGRCSEMGLFDDLGNALKKVEDDLKKSDLDKHMKDLEQGLNKAGRDVSTEIDKARAPAEPAAPAPSAAQQAPPAGAQPAAPRPPHPGYAKIAAWMKRTYKGRISGAGDPLQRNLELEQLSSEACSGLSEKTRKGFLDYLRKQDYEPLLR